MLVLRRLVLILLLLAPGSAWAKSTVTDARIGADGDITRVELQLDAAPHYHVFYVPDPARVVIDLDEVDWRVAAGHKLQGTGLVQALRYGLYKVGTSRVVLDLQQPAIVTSIGMSGGAGQQSLTIDLKSASADAFKLAVRDGVTGAPAASTAPATATPGEPDSTVAQDVAAEAAGKSAGGTTTGTAAKGNIAPSNPATSGSVGQDAVKAMADPKVKDVAAKGTASKDGPAKDDTATAGLAAGAKPAAAVQPAPVSKEAATTKTAKAKPGVKPMIVIDAGHGGVDPGALGNGVMEKNITLSVALALKKELLASGRYRVTLTRDSDVYIPLRDRFKIARDNGADLFISLHADSHNDPFMRGASIYTLSETASDAEAADLANQENKSDIIAGVDLSKQSGMVTDILIDLAQRDTINQSNTFASALVSELKTDTLMLEHSPHRSAGFAVLKAPDVPSVLIEMGYVSSDKDEALLTNKQHQARLAKAIHRAIDDFFAGREPVQRS